MDTRGDSSKASWVPATPVKPHQDPKCDYQQEIEIIQPGNFVRGQIFQGKKPCQSTTAASILQGTRFPKSASCNNLTSLQVAINKYSGPTQTSVQGFSMDCVDKNMPSCDLLALANEASAKTIASGSNSFVGSTPATQLEDKEAKQGHEKPFQPKEDKLANNTNGVSQQSEHSSDALSKQVPEINNSGRGSDVSLGRTTPAQQKPRRKRYMPKVVREGQTKRSPNVKSQKPVNPTNAPTRKRKYIQRNETSIPPNINFVDLTKTDEDPPSKNPTNMTRNIHPNTPSVNSVSSKPKTVGPPRKLCRRSLNFDTSSEVREIESSCGHALELHLKSRAQGSSSEIQSTMQLGHGAEATAGKSQLEHIADVQSGSTRGNKETSSKRSRGSSTRVQNTATLVETSEHLQSTRSSTIQEDRNSHQSYIHSAKTSKKQTKRNTRNLGSFPGAMLSVDALADQLRLLNINEERKQGANPNTSACSYNSAGCQEKNTLVVYHRDGTLMTMKEKTTRPRVKLDQETTRVWKLLLQDINSEGINGTDEETKKWWEDERRILNARANSFIKCMHLIQGDRTFSRWKGSVVDSVVGVFLTQNVSDHLSSSAYMSLAARFPLVLEINDDPLFKEFLVITRNCKLQCSYNWEAVRLADINEVAHTIRDRGMNNVLAERIKEFLDRLVSDHGSIDLEWLRDVPPGKAKEYLMSIRGLGLKSVECVRLLTLHHVAFPVDTNVGRIAVRLGWAPLQPLPESLQLHLLEMYPVLSSVQKYLWPRLCKLDQRTLYELHYQMITFGKVFCTKNKPNCNACPLRGECRHFASAFASARLALPGPEGKKIATSEHNEVDQNFVENINRLQLPLSWSDQLSEADTQISHCVPIIEVPASPGPLPATPEAEGEQVLEDDIEDLFSEDPEDIPTIKLKIEDFTQTIQEYIQRNMDLQEGDVSKSLVALTPEAASIPAVKLKNMGRLRTEHQVYELPDPHPLLKGLEQRESDDPCSYLLAIWTPGETSDSIQPPTSTGLCSKQESGSFCSDNTCFACSSTREAQSQNVRGTLLIPCRTAMKGSFPLNGTYFQVNEVFADHDSSLRPLEVPRHLLWNLPRKTVYFGTSIPAIFRGMTMKDIQLCFWQGFACIFQQANYLKEKRRKGITGIMHMNE